ncbi:MAG: CHAT domain-containing protein, partial [Salibacteraceae bacterium]
AKLEQLESGSDSILQARFKLAARTAYQQWDSLQLVFQTDYPKYYEVSYPDTVFRSEAFSKLLSSQEKVALSYFLGDSISFLIGYRNGQFVLDTLPKKSELLPHIQQYERSLSDYDYLTQHPNEAYQDFTQSAYQLHELLFPGKIKSLVQGASHLLIFPDGDLTNLPFEALLTQAPESHTAPDYSNLPYLLHDFNITYSPSALLLLHQSQKLSKAEQHYLGMAPDYDTDFLDLTNNDALLAEFRSEGAALSGNIKEVEAVAQLFRGDYYLNDQADEGRFKADASQYQILHMAMHGLVDKENPLSSRLIFGRTSENEDGMLHAYELYNMSLNADLAVLSACYSGAGKILPGEGSMNIARAFNYAGCPSVLMSLWQADDQAASGLVVDFFGNLRNGRDKSASLAQAKRNYINQAAGLKTHPFFWAGFVVIGDPSSLELSPTFGPLQIGLVVLLIAGLSLVYFLYRKNQRSSPISQRT